LTFINKDQNLFKVTLFLFGAFSLGLNLSTFLHELGHAEAMWLTGGSIEKITLNPFSWSYTHYATVPRYPILSSAAGVIFGTLSAWLLFALVWRWRRRPWTFVFLMTGVAATASNGLYWLTDAWLDVGGDAAYMIYLGVSKYLLAGAGFLLLGGSVLLGAYSVQVLGFRPGAFLTRALVLEGGILPYMACTLVYSYLFKPSEFLFRGVYAFSAAYLLLLIAVFSCLVQLRQPASEPWIEPGWASTLSLLAGAISVIALELVLF
jgi:hypothetical protein